MGMLFVAHIGLIEFVERFFSAFFFFSFNYCMPSGEFFFFVLTLLQILFIVQCFLAFTSVNTLPMFQMGRFYFKFKI